MRDGAMEQEPMAEAELPAPAWLSALGLKWTIIGGGAVVAALALLVALAVEDIFSLAMDWNGPEFALILFLTALFTSLVRDVAGWRRKRIGLPLPAVSLPRMVWVLFALASMFALPALAVIWGLAALAGAGSQASLLQALLLVLVGQALVMFLLGSLANIVELAWMVTHRTLDP